MDYEDNLEAPVWDELNHEGDKTQSLVSNSIESIGQISTNEERKDNELLETTASFADKIDLDSAPEWKDPGLSVAGNPQLEEHDNSKADDLINSLAPEQDPIADLKNSTTQFIATRESGGALFTGNANSPLVFDDTIYDANTSPNTSKSISGRRSGKPRILFDSARAQRNSKRNHSLKAKRTTASDDTIKTPFTDPLKKAEKENEFVEEPLDDRNERRENNEGKFTASVEKNILEQVDRPLYNLPQTGANISSPAEVEENSEKFGKTKIGSKVPPTEKAVAFKVEVKDPVKVGELTSIHVEYTVISESSLLELKYAQVSRRYRDFRWLYRQLQNNHWGKVIPPPPEKQSVGSFKENFIENRRFQMESMLKKICQDPVLQKDKIFYSFDK